VYGRTAVTDFHHVAEEYDRIGPEYQESKLLPFRLHVEEHTTFGLLPDLTGLSVVDLACGDGIYARKLRRRGAARVVGVDISPEMVSLARRAEEAAPIGVEYVLADVANVDLGERFDIAFCSFLFNYATSRGELRALIESVARLVRPGGLVVGCNDYPENPPADFERYRPYGFVKIGTGDPDEGSTVTYRFFNPDSTWFELDNYYLPTDAYRDEFSTAGFASFEWVMPTVSPEGRAAFAPGFWDAYLEAPPMVSFKAVQGRGNEAGRNRAWTGTTGSGRIRS
jgi:ubiquinone/menaquinone biosynthesis C-methylase UbiE